MLGHKSDYSRFALKDLATQLMTDTQTDKNLTISKYPDECEDLVL